MVDGSISTPPSRTILGIRFFAGSSGEAVALGLKGGLVVVPAAPALAELGVDPEYDAAAHQADLVLTDSGLMTLVWRFLTGENLPRTSGLLYLKLMLDSPQLRVGPAPLWIMPSLAAARRCVAHLNTLGLNGSLGHCYIAPSYPRGPIQDPSLIEFVQARRPSQIFIGLGGGTQEKVGLYLRRRLDWCPGIHCVGAAIGFLTGDQVRIPLWADRWKLGWIFRCMSQPRRFVPRYWKGRKLVHLLWRYREVSPVAPG